MKLPTEKSSASFQKLLEDGVFVWNCLKTWLTESFNSKKFYSNISFVCQRSADNRGFAHIHKRNL